MSNHPVRPTFRSADLQQRFEADGFVVLDLGLPAVDAARRALGKVDPQVDAGFHVTTVHPDLAYRRRASTTLTRDLGPHVTPHLDRHRPFHGAFLIQPDGSPGLSAHQDWTFVDERRYRSILVWIPLVEVGEGRGTLRFARGSNRRHRNVRPSPVPNPAYGPADLGHRVADMVSVDVALGQAVAIDHATVHCSTPNEVGRDRPAVGVLFAPVEAQLLHFHLLDDGQMEAFAAPDGSWLLDMVPEQGPEGLRSLGRVGPTSPFDDLAAFGHLEP